MTREFTPWPYSLVRLRSQPCCQFGQRGGQCDPHVQVAVATTRPSSPQPPQATPGRCARTEVSANRAIERNDRATTSETALDQIGACESDDRERVIRKFIVHSPESADGDSGHVHASGRGQGCRDAHCTQDENESGRVSAPPSKASPANRKPLRARNQPSR